MINLTIQSSTDKIIKITDVNSNNLKHTIVNNETVNLSYNNYHLDIVTSTSSYSMENIWINIDGMTGDILFIFIILIIIVAVFTVPKILKDL